MKITLLTSVPLTASAAVLLPRQFGADGIPQGKALELLNTISKASKGPATPLAGVDTLQPINVVAPGVKRSLIKFGPLAIKGASVVIQKLL